LFPIVNDPQFTVPDPEIVALVEAVAALFWVIVLDTLRVIPEFTDSVDAVVVVNVNEAQLASPFTVTASPSIYTASPATGTQPQDEPPEVVDQLPIASQFPLFMEYFEEAVAAFTVKVLLVTVVAGDVFDAVMV